MDRLRIFTGYDRREAVGWHVFAQSVIDRCSLPVEITPLTEQFCSAAGGQRDGSNAFTFGRYLVPYYSDWEGWALFVDGADMLVRSDLADLWTLRDPEKAILVVKHEYKTKHSRKFVGTSMESANTDYPRKNWSSVILWNCEHPSNRALSPEFVTSADSGTLHRFKWLDDELIGELPRTWNHLVGEYEHSVNARLAHFTLGIPGFQHYSEADYSREWKETLTNALEGIQIR